MIEAVALALKAGFDFATEVVKGQPPEFKAQFWEWYREDVQKWRDFIKSLEPPPASPVKRRRSPPGRVPPAGSGPRVPRPSRRRQ